MTSLLNIAGNIPVSAAAAGAGQSLRFEDGDSPSFSFTFGTPTNQIKWTMSFWCKRGEIGREHAIYGAANGGGETFFVAFYPDDIEAYISTGRNHVTNAVFRDPSAWYHIVQVFDSANATANDRFITYVNGVRQTTSTNSVALNDTTAWNTSGVTGYFGKNYGGWFGDSRDHFDGYLANVTFIDGQALTPSSFGEYDDTLWKPKSDTDIQALTFGTNGFYLPFKQTTEAEGFSTVTYTGNGVDGHSIEGVGFSSPPDFVWIKERNGTSGHMLQDSVRGATKNLQSSSTTSEQTSTNKVQSFDAFGFTLGDGGAVNESGKNYVAWCWDAGSGSAVSNTGGTIPSSVKANTAKGFSIATYSGNGTAGASIGHGLSSAPDMVIVKDRTSTGFWAVYHAGVDATAPEDYLMRLNTTDARLNGSGYWNDTAPTSSVFTVGTSSAVNNSSRDYVAYCFHSVSGYSKISSYSGTGTSGNSITGLGFEPAWLMIKRYDGGTNGWMIYDNTRDVDDDRTARLKANATDTEDTGDAISFDSDGFTLNATGASVNGSGASYIYMAFADTRDATFFGDTSGNSNNWTPNALNNTDVVPDSPVTGGNFAVMNPLDDTGVNTSEGNLKVTPSSDFKIIQGTIACNKNYFEGRFVSGGGGNIQDMQFGVYASNGNFTRIGGDGKIYKDGSLVSSNTAYGVGDIVGIAVDVPSGTIQFYRNGTANGSAATVNTTDEYLPHFRGANARVGHFNFGQDSSFAGNATPQGNTDDNGVGDFYYAPPSGFLALTTGNLPATTITAPDEYFNTVLYSGDGNTSGNIINTVGFDPSFVWIKRRSAGDHHMLYDLVRHSSNPKQALSSSLTYAESSITGDDLDFVTGGFEPKSSNAIINGSGSTYVAWNWLAGGSAVSNTDGSITSQVSANTDAGFSIASYVGNGTTGATVGHGLSSAPEMVIVKNRTSAQTWIVYTTVVDGSNDYLALNNTGAANNSSLTAPTGSVFSVGGSTSNENTSNHIAYCFHSVEGYSKIGSYTGNGSSDGTFVYCGFRPAFLMVRRTDATQNWLMLNNKTPSYNKNSELYANLSNAEVTASDRIDLLSNGFKSRINSTTNNGSGATYIFLAFAEAPFKNANAR